MPARSIVEIVRKDAEGVPVLVGHVTDDFIGKQVIDRLYEEIRQQVNNPDRTDIDFPVQIWSDIDADGWDTWSVNNRNSATPLFWMRKRLLWNSVPSGVVNWALTESGDAFSQFPGDVPNVISALDPRIP